MEDDPESPLGLAQGNNLVFYISRKHSLATRVDDEGRSVLHWVCALGDLAKANTVLSIPGVQVNEQDNAGWTPLMIAVSARNEDIVDRLLEIEGVDVLIQNRNGATALHYAASKNRIHSCKLLISKSLQPLRIKDTQGSLPIHRAASIGSTSLINLFMFPDPSHKAASPINAADKFGMSPLHHACAEGHIEAAALLVQLGADVDRLDKEGQTPLECAPDDRTKKALMKVFADHHEGNSMRD